jgi:hypothetical protein
MAAASDMGVSCFCIDEGKWGMPFTCSDASVETQQSRNNWEEATL